VILFLPRLDPKKGLDLLLPAFARLLTKHPQTALVVAGNGSEEFIASQQERAASLGIGDAIVWPGFLEGVDKLAALAAADVFVLPSYSENFGIAAVEAMAAGVPVILSDQVGVAEDVKRCGAGLVVSCDEDALVSALDRLLTDSRLRERVAVNGLCLVLERYSGEAMARGLITLYADCCRSSRPDRTLMRT
jgi:glycosyltransferase involved in cell wall biosynthesis